MVERACQSVGALTGLLVVGGCVPSRHLLRERSATPVFDPVAFFAGRTEGRGSLKVLTRHRRPMLVRGQGVVGTDGTIVLDQTVTRGDDVPTHRSWRLHRVAADRYAGTLTDATGPVTGEVAGNRLHLSFTVKGGLHAQQWLYLRPGGQTARNRMVVTKFGIPVARLNETIERLPE